MRMTTIKMHEINYLILIIILSGVSGSARTFQGQQAEGKHEELSGQYTCCLGPADLVLGCKQCQHMAAKHKTGECVCINGFVLDPFIHECLEEQPHHPQPHITTLSRRLREQSAVVCPPGCDVAAVDSGEPQRCMLEGTGTDGYRCAKCLNNLLLNLESGTCGCAAGYYTPNGTTSCMDCDKGHWCTGGWFYGLSNPRNAAAVQCPQHDVGMTTAGLRSAWESQCLNMPGHYYVRNDGTGHPKAVRCPEDTYGQGLAKQQACVGCGEGYTTHTGDPPYDGKANRRSCVLKDGYFLEYMGHPMPCPKGEYKTGTGAAVSCTKCASGVTTPSEASTSAAQCSVLMPSYYAANISLTSGITSAKPCPQKYYCPGGGTPQYAFDPADPTQHSPEDTLVYPCPSGTFTQQMGASAQYECMTPPGFKTTGTGSAGTTEECPAGQFRADWRQPAYAASCTPCGDGIAAAATEQIAIFDAAGNSTAMAVRGSAEGCFINPGQGMFFNAITKSYWAANCSSNNYGANSITYGLTADPCQECPRGMVTDALSEPSKLYLAPHGFTHPLACVTKRSYGVDGLIASKCAAGSWNAGGNYKPCTACGPGLSTHLSLSDQDAYKQDSEDDCTLDVGFGFHDGAIMPCPIGTYNPKLQNDTVTPCQPCGGSLTTAQQGGRSATDCDMCQAGHGNAADGTPCGLQCGGSGAQATYGPPGRPAAAAACQPCPQVEKGFLFDFAGQQLFTPLVVSRPGAQSLGECLAEFAQIGAVAWYVGGIVPLMEVTGLTPSNFSTCVDACKSDSSCQYITYNYNNARCFKKVAGSSAGSLLAFKALIAADTLASSTQQQQQQQRQPQRRQQQRQRQQQQQQQQQANTTTARSMASGSYTMYWDRYEGIGASTTVATATDVMSCLRACDMTGMCAAAGMLVQDLVGLDTLTTKVAECRLVMGDSTQAMFLRSVTRVDMDRLVSLPAHPEGCLGTPGGSSTAWDCAEGTLTSHTCLGTCLPGHIPASGHVAAAAGSVPTATCLASPGSAPTYSIDISCVKGCPGTPSSLDPNAAAWTCAFANGTLSGGTCTGNCIKNAQQTVSFNCDAATLQYASTAVTPSLCPS